MVYGDVVACGTTQRERKISLSGIGTFFVQHKPGGHFILRRHGKVGKSDSVSVIERHGDGPFVVSLFGLPLTLEFSDLREIRDFLERKGRPVSVTSGALVERYKENLKRMGLLVKRLA